MRYGWCLNGRRVSLRRHGRRHIQLVALCVCAVVSALCTVCSAASAYTFVLVGDGASVVAAPGEVNSFDVEDLAGGLLVDDLAGNSVTSVLPAGCAVGLPSEVVCQPGVVASVSVDAADGADAIANGSVLTRVTLSGGTGNDQLSGGSSGEVLLGGDGNDTIQGGDGADAIDGGDGADALIGGDGDDLLTGGTGDDRLDASDGNDSSDGGGGADTLTGGNGNDGLLGGTGNDELVGDDGADALVGADGEDLLAGGRGADRLDGGAGSDDLGGGEGADAIVGGDAPDRLAGGDGNDDLEGGAAADALTGDDGDDRLAGGAAADALDGGSGTDNLQGGEGGDTVVGGDGSDDLSGGAGIDLASYAGRSTLATVSIDDVADDGGDGERDNVRTDVEQVQGGSGPDRLTGSPRADRLDGGAGDDVLDGGQGPDTLLGRDGVDEVSYASRTRGVLVTIGAGGAGEVGEGDVVDASVESVRGGAGPDRLVGMQSIANDLIGGPGDDLLVVSQDGGETDEVFCGAGADRVGKDRRDIAGRDCERVRTDGRLVRPAARPRVFVVSGRLRMDGSSRAVVSLQCAAATYRICAGTVRVTRSRAATGPTLGAGRFRIAPRAGADVTLRLASGLARRVRRAGRDGIRVSLHIRLHDAAGRRGSRDARRTLRPSRPS